VGFAHHCFGFDRLYSLELICKIMVLGYQMK
jgi:hypothetical protein